jgi:hypothetical protein
MYLFLSPVVFHINMIVFEPFTGKGTRYCSVSPFAESE